MHRTRKRPHKDEFSNPIRNTITWAQTNCAKRWECVYRADWKRISLSRKEAQIAESKWFRVHKMWDQEVMFL